MGKSYARRQEHFLKKKKRRGEKYRSVGAADAEAYWDESRYKACTSKKSYNNLEHARQSALLCSRRQFATTDLFAYECPFCGRWHLTHVKSPKSIAVTRTTGRVCG